MVVEFPIVKVVGDEIIISITKDALIKVIEGRTDEQYEVIDKDRLLPAFAEELRNYAESNAVETGLNELQVLFDKVTDSLYESAQDIIELKDEDYD
jgi:hypothetical protein